MEPTRERELQLHLCLLLRMRDPAFSDRRLLSGSQRPAPREFQQLLDLDVVHKSAQVGKPDFLKSCVSWRLVFRPFPGLKVWLQTLLEGLSPSEDQRLGRRE